MAFLSIIFSIMLLFQRLFDIPILGVSPSSVPGYASIIIFFTFISGIQLFTLGILGEYISRIFLESKSRPVYTINTLIGDFGKKI